MPTQAEQHLKTEKLTISGIPVLSCHKNNVSKKPLVIFSHSLMESKEIFAEKLETFAGLGYYAVAFDNKYHGERSKEDLKKVLFSNGKLSVFDVRRIIKETADGIGRIIDYFAGIETVDDHRIGMLGSSMGGYITFRALISDARIKVATPIISSPFWDDVPNDMPFDNSAEAIDKLKEFSNRHSPGRFLDRYYPRALLMQVGAKDIHLNVERTRKFHEDLKPYYVEKPSLLKFVLHEDMGHKVSNAMWDNAVDWFQKFL